MFPNIGISNRNFSSHQAEQEEGTRLIPWESGEPPSFKSFTYFSLNTSSTYDVLRMLLQEPDFFPTLAGERAPASPISPAANLQKLWPLLKLEFSFCHPLSSSRSREREAALCTKPALFLCYITIWAFRLVFLDIGRCVKYWHNPVIYMESRLALSGGCTIFSLKTRACSIVKATLQESR